MARLPYANLDEPATQPLIQQIVQQRGQVLHIYQMLLHSSPAAEGWLGFMSAVRQRLTIPGSLRELIVLRVALLNRAPYEAEQHEPIAIKEGVLPEQIVALPQWTQRCDLFSSSERAALALTDKMTNDVQVDEETWMSVQRHWTPQQIVELVVTIASYNMVSRFLEALEIRSADQR